jgi:hypothetical protein
MPGGGTYTVEGGMKSSQNEEQERAAWPRADASLVLECPCNGRDDLVLLLEYVGRLVCLACPCKF